LDAIGLRAIGGNHFANIGDYFLLPDACKKLGLDLNLALKMLFKERANLHQLEINDSLGEIIIELALIEDDFIQWLRRFGMKND
jgi:hypothetical protein